MGVCIETSIHGHSCTNALSHTLYGCVYWNIFYVHKTRATARSHPIWVCVLKHERFSTMADLNKVTPYMGVCIETSCWRKSSSFRPSHPIWVCVLKLLRRHIQGNGYRSHPIWVCVLKHPSRCPQKIVACHTLYGCVYWNSEVSLERSKTQSHTLYGCVYWNLSIVEDCPIFIVTPYMGVCIETDTSCPELSDVMVTPYMGVCIET